MDSTPSTKASLSIGFYCTPIYIIMDIDKKKELKAKKASMKPKTTTVLDKIIVAIRALKGGGPKGSSRAAISKFLKEEFDYDNANALKTALKKGVSTQKLVQSGQSFQVAGDDVIVSAVVEEGIQQEDIKVGPDDGPEAAQGDAVTVAYIGTLDNGYQFDKASSFTFVLGAGEVIRGWDLGVVGMRKGGKRKLIVPSKYGYGKRGCAPDIPGGATLHFIVTMKQIQQEKAE
jgi:FKBP-type peptidyl-prolyl cis-trans isomerase